MKVKLQNRSKSNTKSNITKNARSKKKRFQDVTTKPTKDEQTNYCPVIIFGREYLPCEKKNRSWSDSKPGPLPPQAYLLPPG